MDSKPKSRRAAKPCQVTWKHQPDPAAEAEFWKLYMKLALEALVEAEVSGRQKSR